VLLLDGAMPRRTAEAEIASAYSKASALHPQASRGPDLEIRVVPAPPPDRARLGDRGVLLGPWVAAIFVPLEPLGASAPRDADGVMRIAARPEDTVESLVGRIAELEDAGLRGSPRRLSLVLGGAGELTDP
jgi:hypothetical protein